MPITNKTKIRLWNPEKSNSFIENIDMSELFRIDSKLSSLITKIDFQQHELDNIIMKINQVFEKCAETSFGHTKETSKTKDTNMTKNHGFMKAVIEHGTNTITLVFNVTTRKFITDIIGFLDPEITGYPWK